MGRRFHSRHDGLVRAPPLDSVTARFAAPQGRRKLSPSKLRAATTLGMEAELALAAIATLCLGVTLTMSVWMQMARLRPSAFLEGGALAGRRRQRTMVECGAETVRALGRRDLVWMERRRSRDGRSQDQQLDGLDQPPLPSRSGREEAARGTNPAAVRAGSRRCRPRLSR